MWTVIYLINCFIHHSSLSLRQKEDNGAITSPSMTTWKGISACARVACKFSSFSLQPLPSVPYHPSNQESRGLQQGWGTGKGLINDLTLAHSSIAPSPWQFGAGSDLLNLHVLSFLEIYQLNQESLYFKIWIAHQPDADEFWQLLSDQFLFLI